MRHSKAILLVFAAVILFTSCDLPITAGRISRENQLKAIAETARPHLPYIILGDLFSPNGRWFVTEDYASGVQSLAIHEQAASNREISIDLKAYQQYSFSFESWSPNSQFFVMRGYPNPGQRCGDTSWLLVKVLKDRLEEKQFMYRFDPYSCPKYVWSPDSKAIAIYSPIYGEIEINYLETDVRKDYKGFLKDEEAIRNLKWVEDGILLMTRQETATNEYRMSIYELKDGVNELQKLFTYDQMFGTDYVLSTDKHMIKVLIRRHYNDQQSGLDLLNLQDLTIKHVTNDPSFGRMARYLDTGSSVAMQNDNKDGTESLWIYSWESGELSNRGKINLLLNWNEPMQGFVILTGEDDDQVEAKLFCP